MLAERPRVTREVDARLHGEAAAGHQQPIVLGLEVVDIRAVAVNLATDAVAGPVQQQARRFAFDGDRAAVREATLQSALQLLVRNIE